MYIPPLPEGSSTGSVIKRASSSGEDYYYYDGSILLKGLLEMPGDTPSAPFMVDEAATSNEYKIRIDMMPLKRK